MAGTKRALLTGGAQQLNLGRAARKSLACTHHGEPHVAVLVPGPCQAARQHYLQQPRPGLAEILNGGYGLQEATRGVSHLQHELTVVGKLSKAPSATGTGTATAPRARLLAGRLAERVMQQHGYGDCFALMDVPHHEDSTLDGIDAAAVARPCAAGPRDRHLREVGIQAASGAPSTAVSKGTLVQQWRGGRYEVGLGAVPGQ
mmetsp:Transcript_47358/g.135136  ORF Transcript_47358/g.135136 Transcript_47358/m.135136 type:complete len:202 (-) Transcript_47358:1152-1757(-)